MFIYKYLFISLLHLTLIECAGDLFAGQRSQGIQVKVEDRKNIQVYLGPNTNNTFINGNEIQQIDNACGYLANIGFIDANNRLQIYASGTGLQKPDDGCYVKHPNFIMCSLQYDHLAPKIIDFIMAPGVQKFMNNRWAYDGLREYLTQVMNGKANSIQTSMWKSLNNPQSAVIFWKYIETKKQNAVFEVWNRATQNSHPVSLAAEVLQQSPSDLYANFVRETFLKDPSTSHLTQINSNQDSMKMDWFDFKTISGSIECKAATFKPQPAPENWRFVIRDDGKNERVVSGNEFQSDNICKNPKMTVTVIPVDMASKEAPMLQMSIEGTVKKEELTTNQTVGMKEPANNTWNQTKFQPFKEKPRIETSSLGPIVYFSIGLMLIFIEILRDLFK